MDVFQFNESETDVFIYIGSINRQGYSELSKKVLGIPIEQKKTKVLLCLSTFGGDPDAGYRIGRCLQHYYEGNVTLFAPSLCKSSGTLTAIAANNIIIGNEGELGPLDIQLRKTDEMGEQSSGLDIFKAINFLENRVMEQFSQYLPAIRFGSGVSTRLSADIAAKLVHSVIEPIANQIDPIKIGEHQRAIGIAQKYGELLNEMTKILKDNALSTLIAGYPSHGFVIDRKEAEKLFNNVYKPCDRLYTLLKDVLPYCADFNLLGGNPIVLKHIVQADSSEISDLEEQGEKNGNTEQFNEKSEDGNVGQYNSGTKYDECSTTESRKEQTDSSGVKSSTKRKRTKRN